MRIRNLRKYDLYLPYAGKRKGFKVGAGALSIELPPSRYHDALLQRDWKMGKIEVLLDDNDRIVLGPAIQGLASESVVVEDAERQHGGLPGQVQSDVPATDDVPGQVESDEGNDSPSNPVALTLAVDSKRARKPRKASAKRKKRAAKQEPQSLKRNPNAVRLWELARTLRITSRVLRHELARIGRPVKSVNTYLDPDTVKLLSDAFAPKTPPAVTPAGNMTLGAAAARGMRTTGSAHEVPEGVPGMPSVKPQQNAPSLLDLQTQNARINLGQPKFGRTGQAPVVTPGGPLGSVLSTGVPAKGV